MNEKMYSGLPELTRAELDALLERHGDPSKLRELLAQLPEKDVAEMVCGFRSHEEFIKKVYGGE